jgi:hypothetical protein
VDVENWTPMRWPCGPLELEAARQREDFTPAEAEALDEWCRPAALERLCGTPVSCLVLSWASGGATDLEQQRALAPLVAEATRRGLGLVGWVAGGDLRKAAASAEAAGLRAVATESDEELPGAPVLRFHGRSLGAHAATSFRGVSGLVWPGIRITEPRGADASTGPTGPPWLDSNAWYVRLVRALQDPKTLWLGFDPPAIGQPLAGAAYQLAIADSAVYGARWLVSLDPHLRVGLSRRSGAALDAWRRVAASLGFFEAHQEWTRYTPEGQLGVVSDYAGADEFLSFEVLNLLARRGSLFRIVDKRSALAASFADLDAVLYPDAAPPAPELAQKLDAFVDQGGTLVAPPFWPARGASDESAWFPRFRVFRCGKGRLAVSRAELEDPSLLADDAQLLMSHRYDRLRLFNPGTAQFHYLRSIDGRTGVLHALRHDTPDPRQPLTAWFEEPWSHARVLTAAGADGAPVAREASEHGASFTFTPLAGYSALELLA